MTNESNRRFVLGGYDAKTCPEKLRKSLDPEYADTPQDPIPSGDQARMAAGVVFEQDIKRAWVKALGRKIAVVDDCDRSKASKKARERQTMQYLANPGEAIVIWNARLPQQFDTHRTGEPDALLLDGHAGDGTPLWIPVDVKDHASLEGTRKRDTKASTLKRPLPGAANSVDLGSGSPRKSDALQLAHYQRMLEKLGHASPRNIGGIVGREQLVVWHDLTEPLYRHGKLGTTSALAYYDHEFDARVDIAVAAIEGTSTPNPEWKSECTSCVWRTTCHDELKLTMDHITLLPGITPARAKAHYSQGVTKVVELAKLDHRTAQLVDAGVPVRSIIDWAESAADDAVVTSALKLTDTSRKALTDAGMLTAAQIRTLHARTAQYACGDKIWNLAGSIDQARVAKIGKIHRARGVDLVGFDRVSIEEDIDIEDYQGYVYLIGVRDTGRKRVGEDMKIRSEYHGFVNWDGTADGEARIFAEFWAHITMMRKKAQENRYGYRAYYFTHHEPVAFKQLAMRHAGKDGVPTVEEVEAYFAQREVVDLHPILSQQLIWPTESSTLKEMAKCVRFTWRDSDPGGGNSLAWYQEAVNNPDEDVREEHRTRLLEYNADDVHAQVAIRDFLSRLGEARQPGAKLPSVADLDTRFAPKRRPAKVLAATG